MATLGDHLVSALDTLQELIAAIDEAKAAIEAATAELIELNSKIPAPIGGRLPAFAAIDVIGTSGNLPVVSAQLPPTLQGGKLRVTGIL